MSDADRITPGTQAAERGQADFDNFRIDEPRANGRGRPIPLGRAITLTLLADHRQLAVANGLLRAPSEAVRPVGTDCSRGPDRGRGRVALEAENGSGLVTGTGAGAAAAGDLQVIKTDAGGAATFQWQQMKSGDIMLLSLVTDRCIAVDPLADGLLDAQARGATPDHKNGASFRWAEASVP